MNALRTFEAAARHVSFLRAAEELSVTPGAVSRQVKALEQWLGVPLFARAHKQVQLTSTGHAYLEAITGPLEAVADATDTLRTHELTRPLSICCYPTFALRWLVPRWVRFYDAHPDVDVQLTTSLQPVDFATGEFDAAIQVGEELHSRPGLVAVKLTDVELIPVCSPALRDALALQRGTDLARATLLHNAPRPQDWARWLSHAGVSDVDATIGPRFDSLNLSIQAAIAGAGVGIAIRVLVADELASGQLVAPFGPSRKSSRPFFLTFPERLANDAKVHKFAAWIAAETDATR